MSNHVSRRALLGGGCALFIGAALLGRRAFAGPPERFEISKSPAEWRRILGSERYRILREAGTETPWMSPLNNEHKKGVFKCAGCALPLFSSATKFESGTGWPSFYAALPNAVHLQEDRSLLILRTEVHCRRCGGHLGHVFDDGPRPTGKRYCMNGLALTFTAA